MGFFFQNLNGVLTHSSQIPTEFIDERIDMFFDRSARLFVKRRAKCLLCRVSSHAEILAIKGLVCILDPKSVPGERRLEGGCGEVRCVLVYDVPYKKPAECEEPVWHLEKNRYPCPSRFIISIQMGMEN